MGHYVFPLILPYRPVIFSHVIIIQRRRNQNSTLCPHKHVRERGGGRKIDKLLLQWLGKGRTRCALCYRAFVRTCTQRFSLLFFLISLRNEGRGGNNFAASVAAAVVAAAATAAAAIEATIKEVVNAAIRTFFSGYYCCSAHASCSLATQIDF